MSDPRAEVEAHRPNDMSNPVDEAWEALVTDLYLDDSDYDATIDRHRSLIAAAILARPASPSGGLDELRALSDAATPGPWRAVGGPTDGVDYVIGPEIGDYLTGPLRRPNAVLIVAAVNYVRSALTPADPSAE